MSQIVVTFKKDWIDLQRERGVRVIRQLEKWLATVEGVTLRLIISSSAKVSVGMPCRR